MSSLEPTGVRNTSINWNKFYSFTRTVRVLEHLPLSTWGKAERMDLVQPGDKKAWGRGTPNSSLTIPISRSSRRWKQAFDNIACQENETMGISWNNSDSDWIERHAFLPWGQSGSGSGFAVFILAHFQDPTGLKKPETTYSDVTAVPALSNRLDWMISWCPSWPEHSYRPMVNTETFLNLQKCRQVIISSASTVLNMAINTMQISNFLWHKDFNHIISFRDFVPQSI